MPAVEKPLMIYQHPHLPNLGPAAAHTVTGHRSEAPWGSMNDNVPLEISGREDISACLGHSHTPEF